jgi:molecular chaperone HtpG
MTEEELVKNLGTIASSGTREFVKQITGDAKKDTNLIGQFGVGFYSAFMVADRIEVTTKKAGEDKAFKWISEGKEEYEIEPAERSQNGTTVTLFLNEEGREYASRWEIEKVIKKYSNHIAFPIHLHYEETTDDKGKKKDKPEMKSEQINSGLAIWKKPKTELAEKDYNEFYKTLSHDYDDPLLVIHMQAEGTIEYTTLFYIPKHQSFDLFRTDYEAGVKLYIKRVFITDKDKELLPVYLRFVRGIIDSEDLPLNVSREILQKNRILMNIRQASVKKILGELGKFMLEKDKYKEFYKEFRKPIKEGLYEDIANREQILDLLMYKSTRADDYVTLAEYKQRMQPDQKIIYYITGEKEKTLLDSPLLEVYREKNIEVLIMDDEIDDIVISACGKYKDLEFRSVNRSDSAKELHSDEDTKKEKDIEPLIARMKKVLAEDVKDVKMSVRLSDSPCCLVADEKDPSLQVQQLMKAMGQDNMPEIKLILEINPNHAIIKKLAETKDDAILEDTSRLLFEQAVLIEGVALKNPAQFSKRLNKMLERAL